MTDKDTVPGISLGGDCAGKNDCVVDFATYSNPDLTDVNRETGGSSKEGGVRDIKAWTFMVYLDGDNNLEGAGINDFLEMASAGSDANVNIAVQFDRTSSYDTSYDDWTDTRRGIVMPGDVPSTSWGVSIGEANMGDPTTLSDFANWAIANYPAENYALVLWDHGGGWRSSEVCKSACWDDTNGGDYLENREVGSALAAIPENMDLFGYDCCLMAMLECAHQVRNEASVFVTSEETEPGDGWPYDAFLPHLKANPGWTAAQLGADIVVEYGISYGGGNLTTQSATDLSVVGDASPAGLSATVSDLAAAIMSDATAGDYFRLSTHRDNAPYFTNPEFRDLGTFLSGVANDAGMTASIRNAAQTALTAYNNAIIQNYTDPAEGGTGLSIYFQAPGAYPDADYNGSIISFSADTQWDEFLDWWATLPSQPTFYLNTLDVDPGWAVSGEWAFGQPAGLGGGSYGNPDPTGGATGLNVYGVDLYGDYDLTVGGPWHVTTTAIDCSGYENVCLEFERWLNTDYPPYVSSTIDVSANGTTWTNVYNDTDPVMDGTWTPTLVYLKGVADNQSTVYLRWGYQVASGAWSYSGWNIDDVELVGTSTGPDVKGPRVIDQEPSGSVGVGQSAITFHFDEPMDTASFGIAEDLISFTGPGGDLMPQVTGFSWPDDSSLRVAFNPQSAVGTYTMVIGPHITDDAPSFNPMNQNNNTDNGEIPDDRYTATFEISETTTETFSNSGAISIPSSGAGSPYPSTINVSGMSGTLVDVVVTLNGMTHTYPDDIDILLVGPAGQAVILLSDAGYYYGISGVNLTFDDAAGGTVPDSGQIVSGTYQPTNYGTGDSFPAPAPGSPYDSMLATFLGSDPNGTWSLYVYDDASGDLGSISGGWSVTITSTGGGDYSDFGDAPSPYPTLSANNGAQHAPVGPTLGANRDTETDGQPTAGAEGDDLHGGSDDEDGVVFTSALVGGQMATVSVTASAAGLLNAWIDFNCNGNWGDAGEQIFTDQPLTAGMNPLSFSVLTTPVGVTYARFRVNATGGLSYEGPAEDGEVEDYAFGTISGSKWNDEDGEGDWDGGETGLANWTIYADWNNNGQYDPGEPYDVTDANGNYIITGLPPRTYSVSEVMQPGWAQTYPSSGSLIIDDFEDGNISEYVDYNGTTGASVTTASAHDGLYGLSDAGDETFGWLVRDDVQAHVAQGQVFSSWVRLTDGSGRAYFAFGATSSGALSAVLGCNTSQFIIQDNNGFNFTDLAAVSQTYSLNHWYRVEVSWDVGGLIQAYLFDSDGTTLLNTVSATTNVITAGGIGFRAFSGTTSWDTVTRSGGGDGGTYAVVLPAGQAIAGKNFGNYWNPIHVWDGGGPDNHWSTPENWNPDAIPRENDALVFPDDPEVIQRISFNDFEPGTEFATIILEGVGYELQGNTVQLSGGLTDSAAGDNLVQISLEGPGGVTKTGDGTLTLTGANTYTGETLVSAGALNTQTIGSTAGPSDAVTVENDSVLTATSITTHTLTIGGGKASESAPAAGAAPLTSADKAANADGPADALAAVIADASTASLATPAPDQPLVVVETVPLSDGNTLPIPRREAIRDILYSMVETREPSVPVAGAVPAQKAAISSSTAATKVVASPELPELSKLAALELIACDLSKTRVAELTRPLAPPTTTTASGRGSVGDTARQSAVGYLPDGALVSAALAARQAVFQRALQDYDSSWANWLPNEQTSKKKAVDSLPGAARPEFDLFAAIID